MYARERAYRHTYVVLCTVQKPQDSNMCCANTNISIDWPQRNGLYGICMRRIEWNKLYYIQNTTLGYAVCIEGNTTIIYFQCVRAYSVSLGKLLHTVWISLSNYKIHSTDLLKCHKWYSIEWEVFHVSFVHIFFSLWLEFAIVLLKTFSFRNFFFNLKHTKKQTRF